MRLTDKQLDWLADRIPDAPVSPKGGRPAIDKRAALRGIFWILDNGAKWKDLPRRFGSKSAVHRWFTLWVGQGVFESIMRDAGERVEERGGYRLYECFIDATFSKARGGGDGVGVTKAGKGVKIMVLVDARGLPVAVTTGSAAPEKPQAGECHAGREKAPPVHPEVDGGTHDRVVPELQTPVHPL